MTYLVAFIILTNGHVVNLPLAVFGSIQSCETAKIKLIKDIERKQRDSVIVASCLDR